MLQIPKLDERSFFFAAITKLDLGLKKVEEEMFTEEAGDRPEVPNVLIIITDGFCECEWSTQSNVSSRTTTSGVRHCDRNEHLW